MKKKKNLSRKIMGFEKSMGLNNAKKQKKWKQKKDDG